MVNEGENGRQRSIHHCVYSFVALFLITNIRMSDPIYSLQSKKNR